MLASRTVSHDTVPTVSDGKSWKAIGLYGRRRKHHDKALGYMFLFGQNKDWKVEIVRLAEANTIFFIPCLFAGVTKHLPGGDNLSIEIVILVVDNSAGLEVPHYIEYFVPGKTKDEEYGWIFDVPLCSEE